MVRLAIVGFGKWGRNYLAASQASGIAALTTVVLRPDSPHRAAAELAGLQVRERVDQLDDVDAAIVATHPQSHPALCKQLLGQGLAVMLEKPAALSGAAAREIAVAAEHAQRSVLVNHQHLFSLAFEELRKRTRDRASLDIVSRGSNWGPFRDYSALWDYGPHDLAMALALMDAPPVQVQCTQTRSATGASYALRLHFETARRGQATVHIGNDAAPRVRTFAAGGVCYDDTAPLDHRLQHDGLPVALPPWQPPLTRALEAFAHAVQAGGTDDYRFGAHWAVQVADVLERAEQSAEHAARSATPDAVLSSSTTAEHP